MGRYGSKKPSLPSGKYRGQQYRGGRALTDKLGNVKTVSNLVKIKDSTGKVVALENQFGVRFSLEDKKTLEVKVNTANAKRNRMLKKEEEVDFFVGGKRIKGHTARSSRSVLLDDESDFILKQKSKSLQRFSSREEYENYINNLNRVNNREYISGRVALYQDNLIKALENEGFPQDLIDKVKSLSPREMMLLQSSEGTFNFGFIYDEAQRGAVEAGINAGIARIKGQRAKK